VTTSSNQARALPAEAEEPRVQEFSSSPPKLPWPVLLLPVLSLATYGGLHWQAGDLRYYGAFSLFAALASAEVFTCVFVVLHLFACALQELKSAASHLKRKTLACFEGLCLATPLGFLLSDNRIFHAARLAPGDPLHTLFATKMRIIWSLGVLVAFAYGFALSLARAAVHQAAEGKRTDGPRKRRQALRSAQAKVQEIVAATGAALSVSVLAMAALVRLGALHAKGNTWWTSELSLSFGVLLSFLLAAGYLPAGAAIHRANQPLEADSLPEPRNGLATRDARHIVAEILPALVTAIPVLAPIISALLGNLGLKPAG
jgi:hypothetical protein